MLMTMVTTMMRWWCGRIIIAEAVCIACETARGRYGSIAMEVTCHPGVSFGHDEARVLTAGVGLEA